MIYGTYGDGCGHFRFSRVQPHRYQRVRRWLIVFWLPVGSVIADNDCNFYTMPRAVGLHLVDFINIMIVTAALYAIFRVFVPLVGVSS